MVFQTDSPLTVAEIEILRGVDNHLTYQDMAERIGKSYKTAYDIAKSLIEDGYITEVPGEHKSRELTPKGKQALVKEGYKPVKVWR